MNKQNHKIFQWEIKDVITTVLLSVVLIAIQFIVNMVCMANHFISMTLSIGFTMFLCAPVYCLLLYRVKKHGAIFVYMTMVGFLYLMMGNWYLLPFFILMGAICEMILWKNVHDRQKKQIVTSWTTASFLYNGVNLLPIWFFWTTYYDFAVQSGMEQSYIDSYRYYFTEPKWVIFILFFTTISGFLGSSIGMKWMNKHFKKTELL